MKDYIKFYWNRFEDPPIENVCKNLINDKYPNKEYEMTNPVKLCSEYCQYNFGISYIIEFIIKE